MKPTGKIYKNIRTGQTVSEVIRTLVNPLQHAQSEAMGIILGLQLARELINNNDHTTKP